MMRLRVDAEQVEIQAGEKYNDLIIQVKLE